MRNPWTREQLDFLSDHYAKPGWTSQRIQAEMPGPGPQRSISAIRQKARYLGLADLDQRGNWKHSPALYADLYDLAVLDYSQDKIAAALHQQHGVTVTGEWVARTMKRRLPPGVHARWARRANQRRAESVARSWIKRRRNAA